jgi:very-short-patch-repair endonuclease
VLKAIYERGLPLPDRAGVYIPDADCKPDFIYENLKIAIFCDGSVHDHPERQEQDSVKRENLKWHARYKVFSFNHRLDLPEQIDKLQAMLRPK